MDTFSSRILNSCSNPVRVKTLQVRKEGIKGGRNGERKELEEGRKEGRMDGRKQNQFYYAV